MNFPQIISFLHRFSSSTALESNVDVEGNHSSHHEHAGHNNHSRTISPSSKPWVMLHIQLLNKLKMRPSPERWETGLSKFLLRYSLKDSEELQVYGYSHLNPKVRTRILKLLLEAQFDENNKFKEKVNVWEKAKIRPPPLGIDICGFTYWLFVDIDFNILVYREDPEEEKKMELMAETVDALNDLLCNLRTLGERAPTDVWKDYADYFQKNREEFSWLYAKPEPPEVISAPVSIKEEEKSASLVVSAEPEVSPNVTAVAANTKSPSPPQPEQSNVKMENGLVEVEIKKEETNDNEVNEENQPKPVTLSPATPDDPINIKKEEPDESMLEEDTPKDSLRRSSRIRKPVTPYVVPVVSSRPKASTNCVSNNADETKPNKSPVKQLTVAVPKSSPKKKVSKMTVKKPKVAPPEKRGKTKTASSSDSSRNRKKKGARNHSSNNNSSRPWLNATSSEDSASGQDNESADDEAYFEQLINQSDNSSQISFADGRDNWTDAPESDYENASNHSSEYDPKRHGRNYARRKQRSSNVVPDLEDDSSCLVCQGVHSPEWILLCDGCDAAYHSICLRPPLALIPTSQWFCPQCQHKKLLQRLELKMQELNESISKGLNRRRMEERLNFVNISINNIIHSDSEEPNEVQNQRHKKPIQYRDYDSDEAGSRSSCSSGSYNSRSSADSYSANVVPARRTRIRKEVNYRFDAYEEAIKEAIADEDVDQLGEQEVDGGAAAAAADDNNTANVEMQPNTTTAAGANRRKRLTLLSDDEESVPMEKDSDFRPTSDDEELDEEDQDRDYSSEDSGAGWTHHRSKRTATRRPKKHSHHRAHRPQDEEEEETESDPEWQFTTGRRKRRAAMRPVRYRMSSSDSESDASVKPMMAKVLMNRCSKQTKKLIKMDSNDEEYMPEHRGDSDVLDEEEMELPKRHPSVGQKKRKILDSSSCEEEVEVAAKSSNVGGNTDNCAKLARLDANPHTSHCLFDKALSNGFDVSTIIKADHEDKNGGDEANYHAVMTTGSSQ